jgi:hypothetical protein
MSEEEMNNLRHEIIDGISSLMEDRDWDAAFIKFFGGY